jgi:type VI secretion system protein ImpA
LQQLAALGDLCDRLFGKDAPSFSVLRRTLEEIRQYMESALQRKLEKEPDPVAAPVRSEPVAGTPGGAGQAVGTAPALDPLATSALTVGSLPEAMAAVVVAAAHWRRAEPGNPAPYLIVRALRWGELRANGDRVDASVQPAPPPQVRVQLKQLATAGQWKDLLDATEAATAAEYGRAWLDPQRYAVKACEQLGFESVAKAIKSELKCLLADYPALPVSVLADDTGAANPETTAWLIDALKWKRD